MRILECVLLAMLLVSVACARERDLIACGASDVYILRSDWTKQEAGVREVWTWNASVSNDIPADLRKAFASTDDCKPVYGGKQILITSSSGGVALVDRATRKALFSGYVNNAHSADMLPDGRIVVASSWDETNQGAGSELVLFNQSQPGKSVFKTPLLGAHGVVWDGRRERLWALGTFALNEYELVNWNSPHPKLGLMGVYKLPEVDGHDLSPVPRSSLLTITSGQHVWQFDRDNRAFRPHSDLKDASNIKSVNVDPKTGQIAFIKAEESWWGTHISFLHPALTSEKSKRIIYKVRWADPGQ